MPLQTVYRPETLDEFHGNVSLIAALEANLGRTSDIPHTFIFTGPSGCGKTTLARIIIKYFECSPEDLVHINASEKRGIDVVRDVIDISRYAPSRGKVRVFMFEECHNLTQPAQEALLDATEEPPPHVLFIFCTTEPNKLRVTFKRRAFSGEVKQLTRAEMLGLLRQVIEQEAIEDYPDSILSRIVDISEGSPGIALKHLDSVIDMADEELVLEHLDTVYVRETVVIELCQTLIDTKLSAKNKWEKLKPMLDAKNLTAEPEIVRKAVLTYMEKVMLGKRSSPEIASIMACFMESYHYTFRAGMVLSFYLACQTMEELERATRSPQLKG